jgi:hypothetical protein
MSTIKPVDLERVELAAREQWQRDPQLRDDFGDSLENFIAYRRADAMGLVRVLGAHREERS